MVAASCFNEVSDKFLSLLLDKSVVFTALLVPSRPHGLLSHRLFDLKG